MVSVMTYRQRAIIAVTLITQRSPTEDCIVMRVHLIRM